MLGLGSQGGHGKLDVVHRRHQGGMSIDHQLNHVLGVLLGLEGLARDDQGLELFGFLVVLEVQFQEALLLRERRLPGSRIQFCDQRCVQLWS